MRVLLASHTSAGLEDVTQWLRAQPGVEVVELYRIEYITHELETGEKFDVVLSSGFGRHLGMSGDDPLEEFVLPEQYAQEHGVPHISLNQRLGEPRSSRAIIKRLRRHVGA